MEAVFGLLGAFAGAVLALFGDSRRRRSEERRHWADQLRTAGGDLVAAYGEVLSNLRRARQAALPKPDDEAMLYVERNRKWGYFRMTPGASKLEIELQALSTALVELEAAYDADDETFAEGVRHLYRAITNMEDGLRELIDPGRI